jgi:DNA-binding winged helix-turn-helix (wHTH) protein/class 3 adenylate cyclase
MLAGIPEPTHSHHFQIDEPSGRLLQGARPIEIRPKALAVLKYLADRSGQLVTKKQILEAVWPDVHVDAAVLKVTIAEIRRALADPSREPRFIETAHRQGYRFIGNIGQRRTAEQPTTPPAAPDIPETRYARSGDVSIAYQVLGGGPVDVVLVMGWVSHLDYLWTEPSFASFLRRLSSFCRLILFDQRGTGLSDRDPLAELPTLEQTMDDVRAVMDAAGSERAVLCGVSEGGAMSALFAASYPQKTAALVMIGPYAKRIQGGGYPWGPTEEERGNRRLQVLPFVGDQDSILDQIEVFVTGALERKQGRSEALATVVSANFKALRGEAAQLRPRLEHHIARQVEHFKGRRLRSGRSRMLATFDGPGRAIRCAQAIARLSFVLGIEARFGLHIGECSFQQREVRGPALDLARRIEACANAGEILVSSAMRDLVAGSEIRFEDRGYIPAPDDHSGAVQLLAVASASLSS